MSARGTYGTGTVAAIVILIELIAWTIGIFLWYTLIYQPTPYRFARPEMLWGLVIGPVLTILHLVGLWMKNKGLRRFSDRALLARMVPGVSSTLSTLRFLLLRHGLSFAIVALAGPETAGRQELVKAKGDEAPQQGIYDFFTCPGLGGIIPHPAPPSPRMGEGGASPHSQAWYPHES